MKWGLYFARCVTSWNRECEVGTESPQAQFSHLGKERAMLAHTDSNTLHDSLPWRDQQESLQAETRLHSPGEWVVRRELDQ